MRAVMVACVVVLVAFLATGQVTSGSVEGTVVDPTGAVVPGALATIESPTPRAGVTSDEYGRFVLDGIPPGNYTLRLQVAGFEPKDLQVRIEEGGRISLGRIALEVAPLLPCLGDIEKPVIHDKRLDSPNKTRISGTVRGEGTALRNMVVRLRGPGASGDVVSTRTDENGGFRFDGMPPGWYDLLIPDTGVKLKVRLKNGDGVEVGLRWKNARGPCL
jgi:hypothetical protein